MSYFDDDLGGGGSDSDESIIVSDDDDVDEIVDVDDEIDDIEENDDEDDDYEGGGLEDEQDQDAEIDQINDKTNVMYNKINQMDTDTDDDEVYLTKFDKEINQNYLLNNHPECTIQNYDEIMALSKVVRDKNNIIIDELHKTIPYITKYERARILGQRAKQINAGATTFVKVQENMIDGYLIAELELQQKRIPFIIRRPLPNGGSEFWCVKDLENISF